TTRPGPRRGERGFEKRQGALRRSRVGGQSQTQRRREINLDRRSQFIVPEIESYKTRFDLACPNRLGLPRDHHCERRPGKPSHTAAGCIRANAPSINSAVPEAKVEGLP